MYSRISIAVRVIASITQLIGGFIGLWILLVLGDWYISGPSIWFLTTFVAAIAGAVLLWRSPHIGILVSLAVQTVQIPLIETPTLTYRLGIGTGLWLKAMPFELARYSFGTSFSYAKAWGTIEPGPSSYGLNVAALLFFCLLLALLGMRRSKSDFQSESNVKTQPA